jgi:Asp-tRNA(Asn)/Glu-tRNA(Gln) amidotransferase A subunit family amidase
VRHIAVSVGLLLLVSGCGGEEPHPTTEDIRAAESLTGVPMTSGERELMLGDIRQQLRAYETLHAQDLPNDLPPALVFDPGFVPDDPTGDPVFDRPDEVVRPAGEADIAFLSVGELGALIRQGDLTSVELTRIYLDRIRSSDPELLAVITLTEDRALEDARRADRDFAAGIDRGSLQGIPYGLKDLFAVEGYPTTWGAQPFRDQVIDDTATVASRLAAAGAVLLAKTSAGALAWGDVWFGGQTRSPWNTEVGASGSSAGSAAGVAAALFPFAIGTETSGSIISPSIRNGVTGLRPTFGAVPRTGAMALSWSMDKVGPLCRFAEDCARVFAAIRGPDGIDRTAREAGFPYDPDASLADLRLGYLEGDFGARYPGSDDDARVLDALRQAGHGLAPVALPAVPVDALSFILDTEAAAAFDSLTRSGRDDLMVRQVRNAWPNVFRAARFVPAVEYIQANRVRVRLIEGIQEMLTDLDVVLAPCLEGDTLVATNLTGHPMIVVPTGLGPDGLPRGICMIGRPFGEAALVTAARELQEMLGFHLRRPPGFEN